MKVKIIKQDNYDRNFYFYYRNALLTDFLLCKRFEFEYNCWDPKDGELCMIRMKPEEILVEVRRDTDAQIVLQNCAQGRNTNRTIWLLVPSEISFRKAEAYLNSFFR